MLEPNYHTIKFFAENLLALEIRKSQILMNMPVYLSFFIFLFVYLSKTVMYEFWYDHVKAKNGENAKLCYMDIDSFIVYEKADDIYRDITEDIETRFGTSNFELGRRLPKGKNKKVIGLMKDELSGQRAKEFVGFKAKPSSFLKDINDEDKKARDIK